MLPPGNSNPSPESPKKDSPDACSPEEENKNHTYVTNRIPWFVHVLWIVFWILAITYILTYQLPVLHREFLNPP